MSCKHILQSYEHPAIFLKFEVFGILHKLFVPILQYGNGRKVTHFSPHYEHKIHAFVNTEIHFFFFITISTNFYHFHKFCFKKSNHSKLFTISETSACLICMKYVQNGITNVVEEWFRQQTSDSMQ